MTDTARTGNSAAGNHNDPDAEASAPRLGRRKMILGVAAAGVAASVVAGAEPAGATDGNPVLLGESNKASATTIITNKKGVALAGFTSDTGQAGVFGADTSSGGAYGLLGLSDNGTAIYGSIDSDNSGQSAIQGVDDSSGGGYGVYGTSSNGTGVYGNAAIEYGNGVYGNASGGRCNGVYGTSPADEGAGVRGYASGGFGTGVSASASGEDGIGVFGYAEGTGDSYGVYASSENSYALYVDGTSDFTGAISKPGGSFKIDHPVDPADKYLYHSFVESPDMKNVYDGTVALDAKGEARVELPDWFEALNRDYRYQLTAIGSSAPELHISREVKDGTFSIAGGKENQKVSWQVTGIRQDAWANANRIPVEVDKKNEDHGRYLHPELFGGEAITALAKAREHTHRGRHTTPA